MISWVVLMVLLVKRAGLDSTHMIDRTEHFVHGVVTPFHAARSERPRQREPTGGEGSRPASISPWQFAQTRTHFLASSR